MIYVVGAKISGVIIWIPPGGFRGSILVGVGFSVVVFFPDFDSFSVSVPVGLSVSVSVFDDSSSSSEVVLAESSDSVLVGSVVSDVSVVSALSEVMQKFRLETLKG